MNEETGRRERVIREVSRTVTDAVVRGADAAENAAESIKETLKGRTAGERPARDNVVMVRVDRDSLARLDDLVESELAGSRSEAAAFLIAEGIKSRRDLFNAISAKVEEIRRARDELKALLNREGVGEG